MSLEALGHVFGLLLPASEKLLVICLANHADKFGDSIFPALETLEQESGMSRSTIKRALKELLQRGVIEQVAHSTGVSPAFYRILGVPEPREVERQPQCPAVLRRAVILTFASTCEYCKRPSESRDLDPDGKPWNVDRVVPGKRGGVYSPDNVTLSCRACNGKKKSGAAPTGTRTLTDLQRAGRGQIEPSLIPEEGAHGDPSRGFVVDGPGAHRERWEGVDLNPEPITDPFREPVQEKAGAPPLAPLFEFPEQNLSVITKIAHEALDLLGLAVDLATLTDAVKARCAALKIAAYPPADLVRRAIDAALWQRRQPRTVAR